ncbi:hypothetical protein BXZ70DRAFT_629787 [Cristinia sonorae]|uniref:FAD-binding FR-type domain-containing protein n=1 Tax=Cristinia sonorae TaxID=1940300 RepID=A0A8K0UEG3_9AGAR|nr:hypothetical protein BXZ70DRAFT_629787 [Cristinia sonorae]
MSALSGWHPGEQSIQIKLGIREAVSQMYFAVDGEMPEEHRTFHTTRLPFIPITTLDDVGRPWTSIAASPSGELGFTTSPRYDKLRMAMRLVRGDPLEENLRLFGKEEGSGKVLIAGIGIEFSTRRRNKFAGHVTEVARQGDGELIVELEVTQALGNCPKYINVRELVPHPDVHPEVVHRNLHLSDADRLPEDVIEFIHASDTVFLGTSYVAKKEDELFFPSHVGQNQRGGRQGFVRASRSDGRTVVLPDYSGNRFMSSLGNIESTPLASLSFVSFTEGHILYLTGTARTLIGPEAQNVMPRQTVLTTLHTTGFVFIRDALTVRQRPGTTVERSPYSPPVKLLAEELLRIQGTSLSSTLPDARRTVVVLESIEIHSEDLATFRWKASAPVPIEPGQAAVLDFKGLLGPARYSHMAPWNPASINDDRVRTWTVSRAENLRMGSTTGRSEWFAVTMREKKGGAVTGALFAMARKVREKRPELLRDATPLGLKVQLVGIVGEFTLDAAKQDVDEAPRPMVWFAGGIGVTPFLSMLTSLTAPSQTTSSIVPSTLREPWDIHLILSTREPEVLTTLILDSLQVNGPSQSATTRIHLTVDVFSTTPFSQPSHTPPGVTITAHTGRLDAAFIRTLNSVAQKSVYLCGPPEYERTVLGSLAAVGVVGNAVRREGFEY